MNFPDGWLNHRYSAMLHCRGLCKRNMQFTPSRGAKIFNLFLLLFIITFSSSSSSSFPSSFSSHSSDSPPLPHPQLHSFGESSAERRSSFICSLVGPAIKRTHIQLHTVCRRSTTRIPYRLRSAPNSASIETPLHSPISTFPFVAIQETFLSL